MSLGRYVSGNHSTTKLSYYEIDGPLYRSSASITGTLDRLFTISAQVIALTFSAAYCWHSIMWDGWWLIDNLHTRSDNTPPPNQHSQSTSRKPISDQDISATTWPHFVSEFSISGVLPHSRYLLSEGGGHVSAKVRCDYCVNNAARLDGPQLKKRKIISIDMAGMTGSKGE